MQAEPWKAANAKEEQQQWLENREEEECWNDENRGSKAHQMGLQGTSRQRFWAPNWYWFLRPNCFMLE
jgi:hypothetical protein